MWTQRLSVWLNQNVRTKPQNLKKNEYVGVTFDIIKIPKIIHSDI